MKIVIEVPVPIDLTETEFAALRHLFCDAFAEFQNHRETPTQYVDARYPNTKEYSWLNRPKKIAEVAMRVKLAEKLRNAFTGAEFSFEASDNEVLENDDMSMETFHE